jgi:hypothetical protein
MERGLLRYAGIILPVRSRNSSGAESLTVGRPDGNSKARIGASNRCPEKDGTFCEPPKMRTQCGHEIPRCASPPKRLCKFSFLIGFWSRRAGSNRRPADYELVSPGLHRRPPASVNVYGARGWGRAGFHQRPPRLWASTAVAVTVAVKVAVRRDLRGPGLDGSSRVATEGVPNCWHTGHASAAAQRRRRELSGRTGGDGGRESPGATQVRPLVEAPRPD